MRVLDYGDARRSAETVRPVTCGHGEGGGYEEATDQQSVAKCVRTCRGGSATNLDKAGAGVLAGLRRVEKELLHHAGTGSSHDPSVPFRRLVRVRPASRSSGTARWRAGVLGRDGDGGSLPEMVTLSPLCVSLAVTGCCRRGRETMRSGRCSAMSRCRACLGPFRRTC